MATPKSEPEPVAGTGDDLQLSREAVRSAARWFVTALGAVGAVLLAGSQLSSLGTLPTDSVRFFVAVAGVGIGLLALLLALGQVVGLLAGRKWSFEDLVEEWERSAPLISGRWRKVRRWHRSRRYFVGTYLREHQVTVLGGLESVPQIADLYAKSEPGRKGLDDLVGLMAELLDKAAYIWVTVTFARLRRVILAAVLVGAAGITVFAWAANPAKPDDLPPELRNAVLRGADLRGASLRGADLTGADLTGANLGA